MNIHDVRGFEYPTTCWLTEMFRVQEELRKKYHGIEKKNGLLQTEEHPLDLNDRFSQQRVKDFCWRIVEELGEAHECYAKTMGVEVDIDHYREELIDSLHFLIELSICVQLYPTEIVLSPHDFPEPQGPNRLKFMLGSLTFTGGYEHLYQQAFKIAMYLGLACNCLKNKPWKTTHQLTDIPQFRMHLMGAWHNFFHLLGMADFTPKMVFDYYTRKAQVNQFRQRSGY